MTPRVCFVGVGAAGSFAVRGRQIAAARPGWRAVTRLDAAALADHDVFCFVKAPQPRAMQLARSLGKRVVLDVVDGWRQPEDDARVRTVGQAVALFRERWRGLPLDGVIFPNDAFRADLGHLVPRPVTIWHHHRPGLEPAPLRAEARAVGYEGERRFLGEWEERLPQVAGRLGLRVVWEVDDLRAVDLGFAGRGGVYGGVLARRYKSNVKLANFVGAGLPCVVHAWERGYAGVEGAATFSDTAGLERALRGLLPYSARLSARAALLARRAEWSLEAIARVYEAYFAEVWGG